MLDDNGAMAEWGDCGPDCVMHEDAWAEDKTMKVTHHYEELKVTTPLKLYVIMSSSLLLIGLMVTCLGIKCF